MSTEYLAGLHARQLRRELSTMLNGYRVVELGIWVAGPAAGGLLSDWGAEVIKVEPPKGDPMRALFGAIGANQDRVPPYELDNRGKRCVVIDLQTDEGRADMDALLATADVFITNIRLDALERLSLDADSLRARFPRLVYALVTGYGSQGPDRDRAGYDVGAFWARSSLAATIAPPDQMPPALRSGVGDHVTGTTLTAGILAALLNRERTGEGRFVETSLLRTGIYMNGWDISTRSALGRIASTKPRTRNSAPLIGVYSGADGHRFWLLGLEQDRHWKPTLKAIGREDLAEDERFLKATHRSKNCEALIEILDQEFAKLPRSEWIERFDANDVWWAPVNTIPEVLVDPQAAAAGAWIEMHPDDPSLTYQGIASPITFSDYEQKAGRVQSLGEETESVLGELRTI